MSLVVTSVSDFDNELSDVDQFSGLQSPWRQNCP